MRALDVKLLRDLWRIRGQAISIAFVTAVGTAAFVTLLGTLYSLEETQAAYYERYRFAEIFCNVRRAPDVRAGDILQIPGVRKVTTRIIFNVVLDIAATKEPVNGLLVSAPAPGAEALNDVHIRRGRSVRPGSTDEVVMTETFAEQNKLDVGQSFYATIKGQRRKLIIVGIGLSPEYVFFGVPGAMVPDNRRFGVLWMDRDALTSAFDMRGAFNDVAISLTPFADEKEVINRLDRLLDSYGGIGAYARKDHVSHATLDGDINRLRTSIFIAAPAFLGVVAFLLHTLMMRHVETEREYIGVLKAFGYSDVSIAWHYMKLVMAIIGVGLVIGLLGGLRLGRFATELYAANYRFPVLYYALTPAVLLQATAVQLAAALFGGLSSCRKAVLLQPAVAMRAPPPPVYRRTFLEWMAVWLTPDQPTRMIMRHIARWPLRSGMTVLGIALATAVLLAPMAVLDSVKHMIDVHFFRAERQDLTVAFAQVRPERAAVFTMADKPGVLQIQPFRATMANVRFGRNQRRITVIGRHTVNELSRPLLTNSDPLEIPTDGIVVSRTMASWLGAGIGDYLDIQFLENRRPQIHVPIVGIAESHTGQSFFQLHMHLPRLNAIMGDSDVVTGVHLKVDPTKAHALYDEIKKIPSITGAVSHTTQLEAMRRMMAQTTSVTILNIVFAGIIVFGIVYNNARISLAERSRELATMRMLGFTRLEVSYILAGELVLLTLAAMVIGCAIGYGLAWRLTEGASNVMFRLPLWVERDTFGYTLLTVMATVGLSSAVVIWRIFRFDLIAILKLRE